VAETTTTAISKGQNSATRIEDAHLENGVPDVARIRSKLVVSPLAAI
jgi:hypothetical protein